MTNQMKVLCICALLFALASAEEFLPRYSAAKTSGANGRIINGHKAATGQFPYQVGLNIRVFLGSSWCGGSLIHPQWVLTAAHCLTSARSVVVSLGATVRTKPELEISVPKENLIYHADFNVNNMAQNDIGLIKLPNPVTLTRRIQLVDLQPSYEKYRDLTGEAVVSTGWGKVTDRGNVASDLQYVTMKVSDGKMCSLVYEDAFTKNNVCIETDVDRTSTCSGDSGGPLVMTNEGVQVGIVSYGSNVGCEAGYPIAFTRVGPFVDWINNKTGLNFA